MEIYLALVWFAITVSETMTIPVVLRRESLAAYFTCPWFDSRVCH